MEWPRLGLEQLLLDARSGTWGSAPDESKSVYPVLRSTNIQDGKLVVDNPALRTLSENAVEKYLLVKGDILVTTSSGSSRLLGKNAIIEELPRNNGKYVFSNFTWRLRPATSHVIPKFLYYYLNSPTARTELERIQSTTSGLRNLNTKLYLAQQVPLPPLSEQRRIVELLDQAERIRRLHAEANTKAERILPALFIKMFGDPVTNPMGWPKRSISELATVITGNTPPRKKQEYFGDYIERVKSDNLNTPSHYITPTSEHLSEEGAKVGRKALPGSALVTCIAGSPSAIGNVALADREVAFNQQINAAVPRRGVDCYYLYGHFVVGKRLVQTASTGGMKGIVTKNRFCEIEFLAPPSDLQERFGYRCKQICEQTEARLNQAGRLDRLFSSLLYRAFTGDLTVSWHKAHKKELLQEMEQ